MGRFPTEKPWVKDQKTHFREEEQDACGVRKFPVSTRLGAWWGRLQTQDPRPEAPRGHHAGAAAAVRVFQRGERAQVAGAAGACAEKGEEHETPLPGCSLGESTGPGSGKGWGGGARGAVFLPGLTASQKGRHTRRGSPALVGSRC